MRRIIYIGAALLAFASAGGASRKAGVQVVVRQQGNGEWQMYIFGLPACPSPGKNAQVVFATDQTRPLEVECDAVGK